MKAGGRRGIRLVCAGGGDTGMKVAPVPVGEEGGSLVGCDGGMIGTKVSCVENGAGPPK